MKTRCSYEGWHANENSREAQKDVAGAKKGPGIDEGVWYAMAMRVKDEADDRIDYRESREKQSAKGERLRCVGERHGVGGATGPKKKIDGANA